MIRALSSEVLDEVGLARLALVARQLTIKSNALQDLRLASLRHVGRLWVVGSQIVRLALPALSELGGVILDTPRLGVAEYIGPLQLLQPPFDLDSDQPGTVHDRHRWSHEDLPPEVDQSLGLIYGLAVGASLGPERPVVVVVGYQYQKRFTLEARDGSTGKVRWTASLEDAFPACPDPPPDPNRELMDVPRAWLDGPLQVTDGAVVATLHCDIWAHSWVVATSLSDGTRLWVRQWDEQRDLRTAEPEPHVKRIEEVVGRLDSWQPRLAVTLTNEPSSGGLPHEEVKGVGHGELRIGVDLVYRAFPGLVTTASYGLETPDLSAISYWNLRAWLALSAERVPKVETVYQLRWPSGYPVTLIGYRDQVIEQWNGPNGEALAFTGRPFNGNSQTFGRIDVLPYYRARAPASAGVAIVDRVDRRLIWATNSDLVVLDLTEPMRRHLERDLGTAPAP